MFVSLIFFGISALVARKELHEESWVRYRKSNEENQLRSFKNTLKYDAASRKKRILKRSRYPLQKREIEGRWERKKKGFGI